MLGFTRDRSGSRTHSTSPTRDNKAAPTAAEAMKTVRLSFEEHPKESLHVMLFDQVANSRCEPASDAPRRREVVEADGVGV